MTPDDLLERYSRGQRKFPWVDLQGQAFDRVQCPDLVLTRAKLSGSRWPGAKLDRLKGMKLDANQSQFPGASLCGAMLLKATLTEANLRQTNLAGANLDGAILTGAVLNEADLRGTVLDRADLRGANLSGTIWQQTRADGVIYDEATIAPDGSAWASWQQTQQEQAAAIQAAEASLAASENDSEQDSGQDSGHDTNPNQRSLADQSPEAILAYRTDPRRTFTPRILSLQDYRPEVVKFAPRDLRQRSLFDHASRRLLLMQVFGYGSLGLVAGAYGLHEMMMLIVALAIVSWRWDRQLTLVAPLLAIVSAVSLLIPLAGLMFIGLMLAIVMLVLTLNFTLQYGFLAGLRNAVWIGCWALLFLLGMNALLAVLGGLINIWVGLLVVVSSFCVSAGSTLWIDLAQRGYSERQGLLICAVVGSGSWAIGWGLTTLLMTS